MEITRQIFAADDWGFSPAINAGVLNLAEHGLLRSVSVAGNAPHLSAHLPRLWSCVKKGVKISLHLNLTYGHALTPCRSLINPQSGEFYSHKQLMWRGLLRRIDEADIIKEFKAQLKAVRSLHLPVTQLDGHHHVHLLPFVEKALTPHLKENGIETLRVVKDRAHPMSYLQTLYFLRTPRKIELNFGNYLRASNLKTKEAFTRKIAGLEGKFLLTHPATHDDFDQAGMNDGLRTARIHEMEKIMEYWADS